MEKSAKRKLILGLIILLIVINVSSIITIYYNSKVKTKQLHRIELEKEQMRREGMYRYFKYELNLSDAQFSEFKSINQSYTSKTKELSKKLRYNRKLMVSEIANKNPNIEFLDSISRDIGELHYQLKTLTYYNLIELKSICNDEQQESLKKLYYRMISDQENIQKPNRKGNRNNNKPRKRNRRQEKRD